MTTDDKMYVSKVRGSGCRLRNKTITIFTVFHSLSSKAVFIFGQKIKECFQFHYFRATGLFRLTMGFIKNRRRQILLLVSGNEFSNFNFSMMRRPPHIDPQYPTRKSAFPHFTNRKHFWGRDAFLGMTPGARNFEPSKYRSSISILFIKFTFKFRNSNELGSNN